MQTQSKIDLSTFPHISLASKQDYTVEDIRAEIWEWYDLVAQHCHQFPKGIIEEISFNKRFKKVLGRCHKNPNGTYRLEFNPNYFHVAATKNITEVILHEFLHTFPCAMNHTGNWKTLATQCNALFGVNVSRTTYDANFDEFRKANNPYNYFVYCPKCNKRWGYRKLCSLVKYPEHYKCGKCGTTLKSIRADGTPVMVTHNIKITL